jgi:hypothetical protein
MESSAQNVVEICAGVMKIQTQNTSEGCSTRAAFVILEGSLHLALIGLSKNHG